MPDLTSQDVAVRLGQWYGQGAPLLHLSREAAQALALWPADNFGAIVPAWPQWKRSLEAGIQAMAARRQALLCGAGSFSLVVSGSDMRDDIAWLETSGTPLCPATQEA